MLSINFKGITPQNRFYKYSVIGNNNSNKIKFILSAIQNDVGLSSLTPYIKVQSAGGTYLDKIRAVASVEDETIAIIWTMTRKSLSCRNLTIQLQFEDVDNNNDVVWQTSMIELELENTIKADEEIEEKNPTILQQMAGQLVNHEERITDLEGREVVLVWGNITGTLSNQTDLINYIGDQLSVKANQQYVVDEFNAISALLAQEVIERQNGDNAKLNKASVKNTYNDDVGNVYDVHYINEQVDALKKQAEFIGEMNSTATSVQELTAELDAYVFSEEERQPRKGDLVNVRGGAYDNQQWYRKETSWTKFSDIDYPTGSVNTNNSTSLPVPQTPEDVHSALNFHKVSKTGKASDLVDFNKLVNTDDEQSITGWKKFEKTTIKEIYGKSGEDVIIYSAGGTPVFNFGNANGRVYCRYNFTTFADNSASLGTANYKWQSVYTYQVNFGNKVSGRTNPSKIETDNYDGIGFWVNGIRALNIYDNALYFNKTLLPSSNDVDLGDSSHKFRDLHISRNITDGTNSFSAENITEIKTILRL